MKIYVDFDDCLCETAMYFVRFVADNFGKDVPYEKMAFFDMKKSFDLTDEQYDHMMEEGHKNESLLSLEETPGAVKSVNGWIDRGYDVSIITGRPFGSFDASREWLDRHGLERAKLYCLNKYGRDNFIKNSVFNLEIEDYLKMHFDFAVEDSPTAFRFFEHLPDLKVMVIDRPWNRDCTFPTDRFCRCFDWETIVRLVK
ncbi:MAG: 2-dehydropantoate 2-reductase [Lachnospiraceae bacterium]|nr:2-dehydropantoate 2-reductase [Lachnospiraceae bacterium]